MAKRSRDAAGIETNNPTKIQKTSNGAGKNSSNSEAGTSQKLAFALEYLELVKKQLNNQPGIYQQFLSVMKEYKSAQLDTAGVVGRVSVLFENHENLMQDFKRFLPTEYNSSSMPVVIKDSKPRVPSSAQPARSIVPKTEPTGSTNTPNTTNNTTSGANLSLAFAFPSSTQNQAGTNIFGGPQRQTNQTASSSAFRAENNHEKQKDVTENATGNGKTLAHERDAEKGSSLMKDDSSDDEASAQRAEARRKAREEATTEKCRIFIGKVKSRFAPQPDKYKKFLRVMYLYTINQIPLNVLFVKLTNLLKDHVDLLCEFPKYLPDPQTARAQSVSLNVANVKDYNFFEATKQQLKNENNTALYTEFLKCLSIFNNEIISLAELMTLVEDLFSDYPELYQNFRNLCYKCDTSEHSIQDLTHARKFMKPMLNQHQAALATGIHSREEIDYSSCKRYGPSYRALPSEFMHPPSSGRTQLCNQVLNDVWVSLPTGSEEGANFKSSRKNQYEEILFKCEDDRYELDMIIELNYSTLQTLTEAMNHMKTLTNQQLVDYKLDVEGQLSVLHLRSIERIYADKGREIIASLFQNPAVSIPCVVRRLQQKDQEWRQARLEWNKTWRGINEKNYHKSLDHQSSNFKQKDLKKLTEREFQQEISKQKYEHKNAGKLESVDHLSLPLYHWNFVMVDVLLLIELYSNVFFSSSDAALEEMRTFMNEFLYDFFQYSGAKAGETGPSPILDRERAKTSVMYGNSAFYVFLRLFQILYSRIAMIMKMAKKTLGERIPAGVRHLVTIEPNLPMAAKFNSIKDIYRYFIDNLLRPLLLGDLEQSKYEEECKQLFGISSYTLFTLDRIIKTLVSQMQMLFSDEQPSKLLALYAFETNRYLPTGENLIYKTNALEIIEEGKAYRFSFSHDKIDGKAGFYLLDSISEYPMKELASTKEKYTKYLKAYTDLSTPSTLSPSKQKIFLQRNVKKMIKSPRWDRNLIVDNQLEGKICMNTSRLFYVQGTEDFFYRKSAASKRTTKKTSVPRSEQPALITA